MQRTKSVFNQFMFPYNKLTNTALPHIASFLNSTDSLLSQHIRTIDRFFYDDLWYLLSRHGQSLEEIEIEEGENETSAE